MSKPSSRKSNKTSSIKEFIQLYMREVPNFELNAVAEAAVEKVRDMIMRSYRPTNDPTALTREAYEAELDEVMNELREDIEIMLKERVNSFVFDRRS